LLGTRGDLGYVVTDSASGTTQAIVDAIRALPETIKLRIIF
jgi:D-3-phosphoglycerate dehydrogenase